MNSGKHSVKCRAGLICLLIQHWMQTQATTDLPAEVAIPPVGKEPPRNTLSPDKERERAEMQEAHLQGLEINRKSLSEEEPAILGVR